MYAKFPEIPLKDQTDTYDENNINLESMVNVGLGRSTWLTAGCSSHGRSWIPTAKGSALVSPWSLLGFGLKTAWSSAQAGSQCTTYWSLLWSKLWQVVIKEACHLPGSLNRDADENNWISVFEDLIQQVHGIIAQKFWFALIKSNFHQWKELYPRISPKICFIQTTEEERSVSPLSPSHHCRQRKFPVQCRRVSCT